MRRDILEALVDELVKIGFQAYSGRTKHPTAKEKANAHFGSEKPDWKAFDKNLKSKKFRQVIKKHPASDAKLKKYNKNYGDYVSSKDVAAEVTGSKGKAYKVKDLHNGRLACGCGNWHYRKSVDGGDCKHIKALKKSKLIKKEAAIMSPFWHGAATATTPFFRMRKAKKEQERANAVTNVYGQLKQQL
jgi:hypothetical protein